MGILSIGMNKKLGTEVGILNLPRLSTCPGATLLCQCGVQCPNAKGKMVLTGKCYTDKAEKMYPSCRNARQRNYLATQQDTFVAAIIAEIDQNKLTQVRFHESGDVYDQPYLDKLTEIVAQRPNVSFLMYTKSWDRFNWEKMAALPNISIYRSIDKTTPAVEPVAPLAKRPTAYLFLPDESPTVVSSAATCVHPKATAQAQKEVEEAKAKGKRKSLSPSHYCGTECQICWKGKANVYFPAH